MVGFVCLLVCLRCSVGVCRVCVGGIVVVGSIGKMRIWVVSVFGVVWILVLSFPVLQFFCFAVVEFGSLFRG